MSLNSGRVSLYNHLKNNWTQTPIVFKGDNAGDEYVKRLDPWIYVEIFWIEEFLRSMNGPNQGLYITPGILAIKLFVRVEDGFGKVDQLTDGLFTVFRGKKINNITPEKLAVQRDGDDKKWYIRILDLPFVMRSIKTI